MDWQPLSSSYKLLSIARATHHHFGTVLLYSGEGQGPSYLGLFPYDQLKITLESHCNQSPQQNPWQLLKQGLQMPCPSCAFAPHWMGYIAYEMGAFAHPEKKLPFHLPKTPLAYFIAPSLVIKEEKGRLSYVIQNKGDSHPLLKAFIENPQPSTLISLSQTQALFLPSQAFSRTNTLCPLRYARCFKRIQDHLRAGDIYQLNYTHPFHYKGSANPFDVFLSLHQKNPASFSAFLNFSSFQIISSSPERFLLKKGSYLETRPIKGTIKRGKNPEEDAILRKALRLSSKDQAELVMITDLMRNDLSKISICGSVEVKALRKIQGYSNVFHAFSHIHAKAKQGLGAVDALRELFPGGSITGCPKIRSMELIYELETEAREVYTGGIGYICPNQDLDFNIAIRTLILEEKTARASFGGGIVIDSKLEKEKEELLVKGASIFEVMEEL